MAMHRRVYAWMHGWMHGWMDVDGVLQSVGVGITTQTLAAFCTQLGAGWSFLGHRIECDRTKHGHRHRLNREGRCKSSGLDQSGAVRRRVAGAAPNRVENKAYAEGAGAGGRKRRVSRGSRSRCKFGHQNPDLGCPNGIIATTKCQFSYGKTNDSMILASCVQ